MHYIVSLIPVLLFLGFLFYLDSFKLVKIPQMVLCVFYGVAAAIGALYLNTWLFGLLDVSSSGYSRYIAPFSEEILKAGIVLVLVQQKKVGFLVDAAIYGFATGTGFALAENIYSVMQSTDQDIMIWVVRGFGTALMHGGTTTLLAVMMLAEVSREKSPARGLLPGFLLAVFLHALYNHFLVSPLISTLLILVLFPTSLIVLFGRSEKQLQQWLEVEFDEEVHLLSKIREGAFRATKAGAYLESVKSSFQPEVVFDM